MAAIAIFFITRSGPSFDGPGVNVTDMPLIRVRAGHFGDGGDALTCTYAAAEHGLAASTVHAARGRFPRRAEVPGLPVRKPAGRAAEAQTDAWVKIVREKADNGGWLVVRGTHVGDQTVAALTRATLSHAVVLDKQKEEVIEAVASGVRVTPLRALLAQAHRLQIIRPPGWTPAAGQAAVARARSHVGQKYDWLGLVAAQDDKRFYCTELAVDSYRGREAGWKLGAVIFPADMATIGTLVFDSGPRDQASAPEPRFARRLADARGVAYAAEVAPGLYRGGQPSAEGIAWLKSKGVKTVLNLRHYHGDSEKQLVESVGTALRAHRADVLAARPRPSRWRASCRSCAIRRCGRSTCTASTASTAPAR